jgi:CubicO group peptidase (beta-lactamase class C family)
MKKKQLLWLLVLLCANHLLLAQAIVPKKLDSLLVRTLDSMQKVHKSKSLSAAVQLPNGAVWASAKGISSQTPLVSVKPSDKYLIGSVVKTITSACIMQMADEQKLKLDDPLHQWLDTIRYVNPDITIRQLLQHNSGLYDALKNSQLQPAMLAKQDSVWRYKDVLNKYMKPAVNVPGSGWDYCNTNYFLLAMIIEKIAGQPYHKELRKRFFAPLGLESFTMPAYDGVPKNIAHVWLDINGDGITDDAHTFYVNWLALNSVAGASGGYYSTPSDVARWMKAYMGGNLISATMMAEVKKTIVAPGQGLNYGLGMMERNFLNQKAYGHGGDLSYSASVWYFPTRDISIAVLCNDSKYNSWTLVPTVTELLKTYERNRALVATSEVENIMKVSCFPNPVQDVLNIVFELPEDVQTLRLEVKNLMGQNLFHKEQHNLSKGNQLITIDEIATLSKGIYVLNIALDGKSSKSIRFMVNG